MKRSQSSTIILIAALTLLCSIFVASAPALPQTDKMATPIKGIGVVIKKNPADNTARTTKTDDEGSFTVDGLEPGSYALRLECKACQSMEIGRAGVQVTLLGAREGTLKRTISKQQLVDGVTFGFEVAGRKGEPRALKGIVSLVK